jgi:transcriptional regulator with XRE-family HTH domain
VARGWSQRELADRVSKAAGVNCPASSISLIENRDTENSRWSLAIAKVLNVDHEWLLTGRGNKEIGVSIDKKLRGFRGEERERLEESINALIEAAARRGAR